ncbi:prohead protease/major capsid protein fusion protein [Thiohalocapsa marina]|uniref:prohead protease/major capsid protein fusion protein n=1 Tax=Thiohalocapsa marina TaxID=424902 RepID=UPI0036D854AA
MSTSEQSIERRDIPLQQRAAAIVPQTFNDGDNTVEVVWTAGARRRAYDFWSDTVYDEELAVDTESIDMSRFEAGVVQVLDGHRVYGGVEAILGVAERAWIEDGQGRAVLRLSQREDVAGLVADIKAGIIRAISFGYSVQRYEITRAQDRTDGGTVPLYRATRWTPQEISFVTVPADPQASTRSQQDTGGRREAMPCEFVRAAAHHTTEPSMPQELNAGGAPIDADRTSAEAEIQQRAEQAAQQAAALAADITELCARHGVPALAAGLIRSGSGIEAARAAVLNELAVRDAASGGHVTATRVTTVRDETETRMQGIEEALLSRVDSRAKLGDNGRQWRGMSLLEIGRDMLEHAGVNTRGMDRMQLAARMLNFRSGGMHGTSDFANLLANVAGKRLRAGYDENPGTYTRWARRAPNAPDFKNVTVVQLSAMPDLLQVNEHGEFKYGSATDGKETYALTTFGRIVSLTRQAIINDDLRAFDRVVAGFGSAAARLENRTVYAQLTANGNLSDGVALFEGSTHKNLGTGSGSALQASSLAAARTAMRLQKGLAGEELNLAPAFLIVPATLEQTAYQLTSSNYVPAKPGDVNEFRTGGRTAVEPIIEPILDAASTTAWYAAAASAQVDTVEYCYLDGAEGPVIDTEMGFETDGVSFRCRLDFAAKALDYRGLYKANGA